MGFFSEFDLIEQAHLAAQAPTRGKHDIAKPDRYCFGDDPCVCVQLKAAREDERKQVYAASIAAVENVKDDVRMHYRIDCEPLGGEVDWSLHRQCDPLDDAIAAIDALMVGRSGNPGTPPSAEEGEQA